MKKIKFSVLMSVYYKEKPEYLKQALDSVFNQTLKPDEVVLVIEGNIPEDLEVIIHEYKSRYSNLKTFNVTNGTGLGSSLNYGVKQCKYDYIMRADTDDICKKDRFEKELNYVKKHPQIDVLGTAIYEFKNNIDEKNMRLKLMPENEYIYKYALKRNPLNHMTVCMKRESVLLAGNYSSQKMLEDYELWIRMINCGMKFANINIPLVYARIGNGFEKRRGNKKQIKLWKKLQKYMYDNKMINLSRYYINVLNIYIMVYTPNIVRKFAYKFILRKNSA